MHLPNLCCHKYTTRGFVVGLAFLFHQRESHILRFNQMACTANWQQDFWPKDLILYLWIDTTIQSEVYSAGRSLEVFAPIKTDIDMSYFSLAHRRLQCKHCKTFPGCQWILFPFVLYLLAEAAPPSFSCDRWGLMCSPMAWAGAVSPDASTGCDPAEATGGSSGHSSHHEHACEGSQLPPWVLGTNGLLPSQNTFTNSEIVSGQSLPRKKPVSNLALQLGARGLRSQDCHSWNLFMEGG